MTTQDFERAAQRMQPIIHNLGLERSELFSHLSGAQISLKCENRQKTGSFKVRGAYNKIAELKASDWVGQAVVAASAGNHAQGVAYAAQKLGLAATIVMPRTAPLAKIAATEGYGADVELCGEIYDDTYGRAKEIAETTGAALIPAFDDDDIIVGQGTIGLEILRELPAVDTVIVPCGGGGLLAGIAACIKQINPRVRVVGVQAEGANAAVRSFDSGAWQGGQPVKTIADGIAVASPGQRTIEWVLRYVDEMVTVSDAEIAETILLLMERCKQVVEPAGAVAVAAATHQRVQIAGERVVCVLSGGNIDVGFIHRIIERGLVQRGRRLQLRTIISDRPGSLQRFCNILSDVGANILILEHDRLSPSLELDETVIYSTLEVSGPSHAERLIGALQAEGYAITLDR